MPRTAEKIRIQLSKLSLSAYYLPGTGWALGSESAGSEKHTWRYQEELSPPKWQEDVCWRLREPMSPLLLPPGIGRKLGPWEQVLCLFWQVLPWKNQEQLLNSCGICSTVHIVMCLQGALCHVANV